MIASQWAHYFDNPLVVWRGEKVVPETGYGRDSLIEFKNWVAELSRTHSVIVVMNTPVGLEVDPRRMVHRRWWSNPVIDDAPYPRAALEAFVQRANGPVRQAAIEGGASIIDPFDWLCDAASCPRAEAGFPLYRDTDHVRATTLAARFRAFDALLDE